MRNKQEYLLLAKDNSIGEIIQFAFKKVFRTDFDEPGFMVIDFGVDISSEELRGYMVKLKEGLSLQMIDKRGVKLNYQWMGRFDQQETTKFHLDNAADQSFLMLGYEPTEIKSKLFFADYSLFARSIKISTEEYFDKYNPMFVDGEKFIKPFVTEVEGFEEKTYKIVLMNNSNSTNEDGTIGVLHKAEIVNKDLSKERVINSTMIYLAGINDKELFTFEQQQEFIITNKISKR